MISVLFVLSNKLFELNLDHLYNIYHFAHVFLEVCMHNFERFHRLRQIQFELFNLGYADEVDSVALDVPPHDGMHGNILQHLSELGQLLPEVGGD